MFTTTFGLWDYVVLALMIAASLAIGIYYSVTSGQRQTTTEYLVAGHSMTFLPVALSIVASFQSSIMMLGMPAESYAYGFSFIIGEIGVTTGTLLEIIVALNFIGRLKLSSPFEYYERRFQSRALRLLANVLACVNQLLYMSVVLYGQAMALQTVTGFSVYGSILITTAAAVIYTTIGGLKAVIWTDVLHVLIMFTGLLAVIIEGTLEAGGTGEVWRTASQSGRLDFSVDPDPTVRHTVWNMFFGRIATGLGLLMSPATLQRISSTKSISQARRALLLTACGMSLLTILALVEGIVAYGYYSILRCDPIESKQVDTPNQIVPLFIMDVFRQLPGMPGLFLSALFSASLSTVSSVLSAMASITWYDVIKPCRPNMSETRGLWIAKATVVFYGVLGGVLALVVAQTQNKLLLQINYTLKAMFRAPVNAVFYLGALVPSANVKGAISGILTSVALTGWLVIGSMISPSGETTPYLTLAPTDQCPVYNMSATPANVSHISNMVISHSYNKSFPFTNNNNNNNTITEHNSRSGIQVLYNLSYILYSVVAILVVFIVGTGVSWATGGWKSRCDPELVIQKSDIEGWCLAQDHSRPDTNNQQYNLTAVENNIERNHGPATSTE